MPASAVEATKVQRKFRNLDLPLKEALAEISSPMLSAFAVLTIASDSKGAVALTAEDISECLEAAGVSISKERIAKSLARAGERVSRKESSGTSHYRIMTKGIREVEPLLSLGSVQVMYVEAGKPRTARKSIRSMLSSLSGTIRISDPYFGVRSLDILEMIPSSCQVFFLTARVSDASSKVAGPLSDFKREHTNVQLRIYPNPRELHDRYIHSSAALSILGHGIKDIGDKESFVITVVSSLAQSLHEDVRLAFDNRWANSTPL
jgi:hypothetical protein